MSELKPCPFCGGKAEYWSNYSLQCGKCYGGHPIEYETEEEAIEVWNKRCE